MGNLLQVLSAKGKAAGSDIFIDFESSTPTDAEMDLYGAVDTVLGRSRELLSDLETYAGAGDAIRLGISNPSNEEYQAGAWDAVCPLVGKLKEYYDYSTEIEKVLVDLLRALASGNPIENLETKQALAKQCAEVLSFVLKFDQLKMNNPAIQNDFSYYRRTLSRMKMQDPGAEAQAVVNNEEANRMSLFYAYPTPMLRCVAESTQKFVSQCDEFPRENVTDCLAMMSSICRIMIETPTYHERFANPDTLPFCQRVMVACVILYDHVHLLGAFNKKTPLDMMKTIKAVKSHGDSVSSDALINALRYSTKHLNDDDTPKPVKAALA